MRSLLVVLFTLALSVACGPSYIDGTTVPDTVENRELVTMIEDYRLAVENRDVSTLAQLVSRSYFENASTTGITDDDYGYEELLKEVLPVLRDNVRKVIYKLTVERRAGPRRRTATASTSSLRTAAGRSSPVCRPSSTL